jgi:hypothetical protein
MCSHGFLIVENSSKNPDQFWNGLTMCSHGFLILEKSQKNPDQF